MGKILVWVASPEVFRAMQAAQLEMELDQAMARMQLVDVVTSISPALTCLDDWEESFKEITKIEISQNKQNGYRSYSKPEKGWKYNRFWAKRQWQKRRR
jgi:hypothetical protein